MDIFTEHLFAFSYNSPGTFLFFFFGLVGGEESRLGKTFTELGCLMEEFSLDV